MSKLKVKQVLKKTNKEVYDIEMPSYNNFILENGTIAHNCSHSSAYSMITYACMYLRHYYPLEWWASVLTNADDEEMSTTLFKKVREMVIAPDINLSTNEMVIDYDIGKIRAKMTVLAGLGETVSSGIVQGAPYKDIKDFVKKRVAGPSLAKKLIHVGVMDSLFPKGSTLLEKMQAYEDAILEVAYDEKVLLGKPPKVLKKGTIDPDYLSMHPLEDFKIRKTILPTLPSNLSELVVRHSPIPMEGSSEVPMFSNSKFKPSKFISGDQLTALESRAPFDKDVYFCVAGYVTNVKEFSFQKNEKKALKLFIDIDGKISERVMWPAWGDSAPVYPKEVKKGSIVLLFMCLKEGRPESRINEIKILA